MALILTQTDIAAPCGTILACTSPASGLAIPPQARQAEEEGSPGSSELSVTIYKAGIQAGVMFESPAVGQVTWQSGTYTVRLNVTTAVADLLLTEVHVCRVNSSCVSQEIVGSTTGLTISMGTTGVKQVDVTGVEQSATDTDRIYVVLIFQQTSHASMTFGFVPDQNIDTPIAAVQEFVYGGDIPLGILPDEPKALLSKSYSGNIPMSVLPSYSSVGTMAYEGVVPLTVLPDAPIASLEKLYAGAVGFVLVPNSTYGLTVEYAYAGNVAVAILPSYASILDRVYGGDIPMVVLPSSTRILDRAYAGDIPVIVLPDFPMAPLSKSYGGDIGLILLPDSVYSLSEPAAGEFIYVGDIPLSALPSYVSTVDKVYQGAVVLNILPDFPIAKLEKSYSGNLPLLVVPDFPKATLEKTYDGDAVLVLTPISLYSLEEALLEFEYGGNVLLSILSSHSLILDRIYEGDVGLASNPSSVYSLEGPGGGTPTNPNLHEAGRERGESQLLQRYKMQRGYTDAQLAADMTRFGWGWTKSYVIAILAGNARLREEEQEFIRRYLLTRYGGETLV